MKKLLLTLCMIVATFGALVHDAEAARLGGGKSVGMQRQSVSRPSSAPAAAPAPSRPAAAPAAQPAPAAAPAPQGNRWLGPLAGLAAGVGLGALLGSGGFGGMGGGLGGMFSSLLMIAALAMVVMFAVRMFRRQAPAQDNSLQYAGVGGPSLAPLPAAEPMAPASFGSTPLPGSVSAPRVPAGFDVEGFVRVAKLNFIRLQAANDEGNLDDLRQFLTPEMFAEVKMQLVERGKSTQQTDVQQLNAEVLEVVDEGGNHIASVRFHGLIRESAEAGTVPFDEVWNLVKPLDDSHGWSIAGIQQLS
jgi:predicted lipid-binding transport protein (Tim44 family)